MEKADQDCEYRTKSNKVRAYWVDEDVWIEIERNRKGTAWRNKLRTQEGLAKDQADQEGEAAKELSS